MYLFLFCWKYTCLKSWEWTTHSCSSQFLCLSYLALYSFFSLIPPAPHDVEIIQQEVCFYIAQECRIIFVLIAVQDCCHDTFCTFPAKLEFCFLVSEDRKNWWSPYFFCWQQHGDRYFKFCSLYFIKIHGLNTDVRFGFLAKF